MAGKQIGSMSEELGNAVQAIARAKLTPEAVPVLRQLDALQAAVTMLAHHGQMQQMAAGGPGAALGAPSVAGAAPGPPAGRPAPGGLPAAPGQGLFPNSPIPNANELAALMGSRAGM